MSTNNMTYNWKAEILSNSENKRLQGLLKDTFDEASFLYDLYKTSTVNEVSQFKFQLQQTQSQLIEVSMRQIIEQTRDKDDSSASFEQIAKDIVDSKKILIDEINPEILIVKENKERLQGKLLSNIEKSKTEVVKLSNVLKTEILLKEVHQVASLVQKIGYSYNFETKKILDPLGLSVTLKMFNISEQS